MLKRNEVIFKMGYYWGEDLYHYGIKRRSGRYPWGSGERPFQDRKAERLQIRKEKNLKAGRERLENRIKNANKIAKVDKYAENVGWKATQKSGDAHARVKNIKQVASEILNDEARLEKFGESTRKKRIMGKALTALDAGGIYGIGLAWMASTGGPLLPIMGLAAAPVLPIAALGYKYLKNTKY